jgi:hypothetical protein
VLGRATEMGAQAEAPRERSRVWWVGRGAGEENEVDEQCGMLMKTLDGHEESSE